MMLLGTPNFNAGALFAHRLRAVVSSTTADAGESDRRMVVIGMNHPPRTCAARAQALPARVTASRGI